MICVLLMAVTVRQTAGRNDGIVAIPRVSGMHHASEHDDTTSIDADGLLALLSRLTNVPPPTVSSAKKAKMLSLPSLDLFQRPSFVFASIKGVGADQLNDSEIELPNLRSLMSASLSFAVDDDTTLAHAMSVDQSVGTSFLDMFRSEKGDVDAFVTCIALTGLRDVDECSHANIRIAPVSDNSSAVFIDMLGRRENVNVGNGGVETFASEVDHDVFLLERLPVFAKEAYASFREETAHSLPSTHLNVVTMRSVDNVLRRFGSESKEYRAALETLDSNLSAFTDAWKDPHSESETVFVFFLEGSRGLERGSHATGRRVLSTNVNSLGYSDRIALFYAEAETFQLTLWTSISLIFITYFIVSALFNMSYGVDDAGLYSRYKTDRGDGESKSD